MKISSISQKIFFAIFFAAMSRDVLADKQKIEIYSISNMEAKPIELEINNKYINKKIEEKISGFNFIVFYPDFSSLKDEKNRDFGLSCVGYCAGQMLISLKNISPGIGNYKEFAELIYDGFVRYKFNNTVKGRIKYSIIDPPYPFDDAFEESNPSHVEDNIEYLFKRDTPENKFKIAAECKKNALYPSCILRFSSLCDINLAVQISVIPYSELKNAIIIYEKIDKFISSMMRNSKCPQN